MLRFQRFKDTPEAEKLSPEDQQKIMHVALPIGNGSILMATDILESVGQKIIEGNSYYISINTDSEEETERIFSRLSNGRVIEMPMQKTFWNAYFGIFKDKFGVQWMVNYNYTNK